MRECKLCKNPGSQLLSDVETSFLNFCRLFIILFYSIFCSDCAKRPTTFSPLHLNRIDELRLNKWPTSSSHQSPINEQLPPWIDLVRRSSRTRTSSAMSVDTLSGQESIASDDLMEDYDDRSEWWILY